MFSQKCDFSSTIPGCNLAGVGPKIKQQHQLCCLFLMLHSAEDYPVFAVNSTITMFLQQELHPNGIGAVRAAVITPPSLHQH